MKEKIFTTSSGVGIHLASVPARLVEEVRLRALKEVVVPPIPTYEVELLDNSKQVYQHDADSIEDPNTHPAEKAAWTAYKALETQQIAYSGNKVMELFLLKGTVIPEKEIMEGEWRAMQEFFEVEVPTHPIKAKLHYLTTELLTTPDDYTGIMRMIMIASGIDPAILEAARNSFRGDVREAEDTAGRTGGEISVEGSGEVVHVAEVSGDGDREAVGIDS